MVRKQKIYSSEGNWGIGSVREPIKELFKFYEKTRPGSNMKIWSTPDNPFASDSYYKLCDLAGRIYEASMMGGRKPASVSAAIVYGVSRNKGLGVKQYWIAKYFGVTEVSLRNNLKYLENNNIIET